MSAITGENIRVELSTTDVYRVNPMDRDSGGRSRNEAFDQFVQEGEEELREEKDKQRKPGGEAKRERDDSSPLDGLILSDAARKAMEMAAVVTQVTEKLVEPPEATGAEQAPETKPAGEGGSPAGGTVNLVA